jgi:hypothetical protein
VKWLLACSTAGSRFYEVELYSKKVKAIKKALTKDDFRERFVLVELIGFEPMISTLPV